MKEEILIPMTLFISTAIVLYYFLKSRHAERMAIIDKGLNEEQLSYLLKTKKREYIHNNWSLKLGVFLIGVGLAVLIGSAVPYDMQDSTITGLIFLFPGIGLLLVYKFSDNKLKKEKE